MRLENRLLQCTSAIWSSPLYNSSGMVYCLYSYWTTPPRPDVNFIHHQLNVYPVRLHFPIHRVSCVKWWMPSRGGRTCSVAIPLLWSPLIGTFRGPRPCCAFRVWVEECHRPTYAVTQWFAMSCWIPSVSFLGSLFRIVPSIMDGCRRVFFAEGLVLPFFNFIVLCTVLSSYCGCSREFGEFVSIFITITTKDG